MTRTIYGGSELPSGDPDVWSMPWRRVPVVSVVFTAVGSENGVLLPHSRTYPRSRGHAPIYGVGRTMPYV